MKSAIYQIFATLFVRYVRGPEHLCKLRIVGWLADHCFRSVITDTESGRMHLDSGDLIQRALLFYGHYEPATGELHRRLLKPGDAYVEVGANVGTFSLLASRCVGAAGRVVSVDPNPFVFSQFLKNLALNASAANVTPVNMACAGKDGIALLQLPAAGNCGLGRLTESSGRNTFVVSTRRLSTLLESLEVHQVALLKIDVEGHEMPVFQDLFERRIFPKHIIVEYLPEDFAAHRDMPALLREAGYRLQTLDGAPFAQAPVIENNLWAVHEHAHA